MKYFKIPRFPIDFEEFFLYIYSKLNNMLEKKLMIFILVFCIMIVIKEMFVLFLKFVNSDYSGISIGRQISFAAAISYIITIICTGFSLV